MSLNVYKNGVLSKICGNFLVDSTLSTSSHNAIENAAVATALNAKQNSTDNNLQTDAKTVTGAINELYNTPSGSNDFTGTTAEVQAAIQAGTIDNDTIVYITDDSQESDMTANQVGYSNTTSGLAADDVQDAIDELDSVLGAASEASAVTGATAFAKINKIKSDLADAKSALDEQQIFRVIASKPSSGTTITLSNAGFIAGKQYYIIYTTTSGPGAMNVSTVTCTNNGSVTITPTIGALSSLPTEQCYLCIRLK